jgi:hypothetical protein
MGNQNAWTPDELAIVCLGLGLFLVCIIATTWQAFSSKDRLFKRIYWAGCAFLLWTGTIGFVYFAAFPLEHRDETGHLIGEMPPEFGLASGLVELGLCATVVGLVFKVVTRALQRWRSKT